jgi:hypothetical protein
MALTLTRGQVLTGGPGVPRALVGAVAPNSAGAAGGGGERPLGVQPVLRAHGPTRGLTCSAVPCLQGPSERAPGCGRGCSFRVCAGMHRPVSSRAQQCEYPLEARMAASMGLARSLHAVVPGYLSIKHYQALHVYQAWGLVGHSTRAFRVICRAAGADATKPVEPEPLGPSKKYKVGVEGRLAQGAWRTAYGVVVGFGPRVDP